MKTGSLRPVLRKLNRAKLHAEEFDRTWQHFVQSGAYAFTVEVDSEPPHAVHWRWKVRSWTTDEVSRFESLPLILGDMLYDLRATLDYLVWQLVLVSGHSPTDQHSFPCVRNRKDWGSARGRCLAGVERQWADEVERLQPYHGENPVRHLLSVLDTINNVNKHRTLPAAVATAQEFAFGMHVTGGTVMHFDHWLDRPIEDGVEFCRVYGEPPITEPKFDVNADPPLRIAFRDGFDHSDGWTYLNADLLDWVETAVAIFQPAFGG